MKKYIYSNQKIVEDNDFISKVLDFEKQNVST
jgi:hypothetical protein